MFDWLIDLVFDAAPAVATALGGPAAGAVVQTIKAAILGDIGGTDEQLENAIKQNPDLLIKLKTLDHDLKISEMQHTIALHEQRNQRLKTQLADVQNSRGANAKSDTRFPQWLSFLITLGFFGLLASLRYGTVPVESLQILNIMVGVLGTAFISVVTYWLGSSNGSAIKNKLLNFGDKKATLGTHG